MIEVPIEELKLKSSSVSAVDIGRFSFFVRTDDSGRPEKVLRNKCAHMGSRLHPTSSGFSCRTHGWTYDSDGKNSVARNPDLEDIRFDIAGGALRLFIDLDSPLFEGSGHLDGSESLELLAHATFMLSAGQSKVLFDPWLHGPTYWGSWHHFPENPIEAERLYPSHIVVTHPHPDHFHPETLNLFDRGVQVLIPNFESGILQQKLSQLGFRNVTALAWEEIFWFEAEIGMAFLRPTSFWEDSSCLVQVRDWFWLNQNDAGAPLRDDALPEQLDLLTSAFDVGASGWPLTWNISEKKKAAVLKAARSQALETVKGRCRDTAAKYFAPFAGWWRHGLDLHNQFRHALPHVTHEDIGGVLEDSLTEFIPTFPSSVIGLQSMVHTWNSEVRQKLNAGPSQQLWQAPKLHSSAEKLFSSLRAYMKNLQDLSLATDAESLRFHVEVPEIYFSESFRFGNPADPEITTIKATLPAWSVELLVSEDPTVTWNHLDIGYWIRWERIPDVYPVNFMRLLQIGTPRKLMANSTGKLGRVETRAVADFIEKDPELAQAILNRVGLPCAACVKSNSDSLENAFEIHQIPQQMRLRATSELSALMN